MNLSHSQPGRYSDLKGLEEVSSLQEGMDFRLPQYRREVFLRFYQFHLKYRSHPGGVYYLIPYLRKRYSWTREQSLWFSFLNGNTQNPITSLLIFRRFPEGPKDVKGLDKWFTSEYSRLAFDTDRRYHKKEFLASVECYKNLTAGGTQFGFFSGFFGNSEIENFGRLWEVVNSCFHSFGRLSAFSYLEYLRIAGLPLECGSLFLEDLSGSKSHRNGLAKVLGRDDLDWHKSNPTGFEGKYSRSVMNWLIEEGEKLLGNARKRMGEEDYSRDVGYFTLESCLCTYKSWYRPNRRYPNVYNDMMHERIRAADREWAYEDLDVFWEARKAYLPEYLRLEDTPGDPGLCPDKQNHYLNTGEVIMMDQEYPCFRNRFNDDITSGEYIGWRKS